MEIGVLLASLVLVFITTLIISALGTGTFFSVLSISAVLGGVLLYVGNTEGALRNVLREDNN